MMLAHKSESPAGTGLIANLDTDAAIIPHAQAESKRFSTLAAQFALAGHELHQAPDGGLFISRWGLTRELRDLEDAEAFLALIGGAQ